MSNEQYADILATVVENGRLSESWDDNELEVEIHFEAVIERGMSEEEAEEAITYAIEHIER